jgi:hypothetical protein
MLDLGADSDAGDRSVNSKESAFGVFDIRDKAELKIAAGMGNIQMIE